MNRAGAHAGAIGRRTARRAIGWTPLLPLAESGPSGFSFTHSAGSRSGELPCRVFQGHIVGRDLDRRPTSQGSADLALFGFRVPGFHVLAHWQWRASVCVAWCVVGPSRAPLWARRRPERLDTRATQLSTHIDSPIDSPARERIKERIQNLEV